MPSTPQQRGEADPLSPTCDASKLLVPQLRGVLLQHGISLPASARKATLIEAYEERVRPLLLRSQHHTIKPSSRGIQNLNSPTSNIAAAQASRRQASPSSSSRLSFDMTQTLYSSDDEDSCEDASFTASSPISTEQEEEESEEEETESEQGNVTEEAEQSFSNRNVFQRSASVTTSTDEGFTSPGPSRPGMGLIIKGRASMKSSTHSPLDVREEKPASTRTYGGLGNKEIQLQLKRFSLVILAALLCLAWLWYVHVTQSLGYCDTGSLSNARLREQRGRFGDDNEAAAAAEQHLFQPTCTQCPPHARCTSGELQHCTSNDFLLTSSVLAYLPLTKHLLPLSLTHKTCKADTRKARLAVRAGRELNQVLRAWRGKVLCRDQVQHDATKARWLSLPDAPSNESKRGALSNQELRFALPQTRLHSEMEPYLRSITRGIPAATQDAHYLNAVWLQALEHVVSTGSVARIPAHQLASSAAASGPSRLLGVGSATFDEKAEGANDDLFLARGASVGLKCRARLAARGAWRAVRLWLALAVLLASGVAWVRWKVRQRYEEKRRVGELVDVALERLQDQEYAHALDPVLTPEPYVPTAQLRDHVLRWEHSPVLRQRLWDKVARVVEGNANVRTRQAKSRGEWLRAWEWVGVSAGTPGISRRHSMADLSNAATATPHESRGTEGSARRSLMGEIAAQASPSLSRLGRSLLGGNGAAASTTTDADTSANASPLRRQVSPQLDLDTSRTR